jgi:hypothetical protein
MVSMVSYCRDETGVLLITVILCYFVLCNAAVSNTGSITEW